MGNFASRCFIDPIQKVKDLATEVCERESCTLWDVIMTGTGKNKILRVSIDRQDRSVSVEDCEKVSTALNLLIDAKDVMPGGAYFLEVSSPGIERHLTEAWQYDYVIGKDMDIRTSEKIEVESGDPFRFQGRLASVNDGVISIKTDLETVIEIPISLIQKAKTVFVAPAEAKQGAKRPKKNSKR